jgi:hypothetical protein
MDTEPITPATSPTEAALALYKEAMQAWNDGDLAHATGLLGIAADCALVGIAVRGVHVQ